MWSSLPVLLLVSGISLADEYLAVSAHKGAPLRSRRMLRGSIAHNVPWQALLHFGDDILNGGIGGGALVSEQWVLTSGRNVFLNKSRQAAKRQPLTIPKVYLGITQRNPVDPSKEVAVEKVVLHPDFQNNSTWENNLALIKLKEAVVYSETVMPIPLPEVGQDLEEQEGARGVVAGWGWGTFFTFSNNLKYLILPVADRGLCRAEYSHGGQVLTDTPQVDNRTFCTGASPYLENVCFGDEGAALAFINPTDSQVYAAGILSFDKTCGAEKYAVYTKLSAYMPWINSVMREDSVRFSALRTSIMSHLYSKQ